MADIIEVSDSLLRLAAKIRILSQTTAISDAVDRVTAKSVSRSLSEIVEISESLVRTQAKTRRIEQITIIEEELKAYKNDIELVPVTEVPTPQNILGFKQTRLHRLRRPPQVYKQIENTVYAPLKVLAFAQGQNRITTGLTLILKPVVVRTQLKLASTQPKAKAKAAMLLSAAPRQRLRAHRLALSTSTFHKAKSRLRLKQEIQPLIESLRPINAEKVERLSRLTALMFLIEKL
jgi:hypothetical protein